MNTINFTRAKLNDLKRDYREAVKAGQEQFDFEGHPLLVAYAKYLIEYLDGQFKPVRDFPLETPYEHNERA